MQKIQSYLYPNRIILLANLAGFTVENTIVYQRTVKIYNGIDNTLEFDIQNADQKRIDLTTLSLIELNLMDASGNGLSNSPYTLVPMAQTTHKGLASVVIPQEDLCELSDQFLKFSITAVKDNKDVMLYADSKFGAVGTMQLIGNAMPTFRDEQIYRSFSGEIDLDGNVIKHSSAIACKWYEAEKSEALQFIVEMTGFIGTVWLEATTDSTISVNSFKDAPRLLTQTFTTPNSTPLVWDDVAIGDYNYFRVYYQGDNPLTPTGTVNLVRVDPAICEPFITADGGGVASGYGYNIINGGAV